MKRKSLWLILALITTLFVLSVSAAAGDHTYYSQYGNVNTSVDKKLCYLTDMAMIISDLGNHVTPSDVYIANGSTAVTNWSKLRKTYGISVAEIPLKAFDIETQKNKITDLLNSGKYPQGIMLTIRYDKQKYHAVVARKIVDDIIYCDDPAKGCCVPLEKCSRYTSTGTYAGIHSYRIVTKSSSWPGTGGSTGLAGGKTSKPVVSVNNTDVTVSWNYSGSASNYDVYLVQSPWRWEDIKHHMSTTSTSCIFKNVSPGDYQAFIIARPNQDTKQSEWTAFTVQPTNFKNIKVTFDPNGGSVSPTSKAVSAGNLIGELPTPTRDGYTFLYWCTEKEKSGMVVEPNTVTVENDLTLYAIWRENNTTCTVTFDPNGGNVSPTTKTVVKGSAVGSIPIPVRQGYTFIGWEAENGSLVLHGNEITVDKDMTLCAVWKADEHTHVKINPFIDPQHPHYTTYTCTCGQVIIDDTPGYLETCDICKGPAGCWGEWSGWSSVPVYGSDTRQVETRTVKVSDSYTEYRYGRYIDSTGTHDCWCGKYLEGLSYVSGSASLQYSDWTTAQYPTRGKEWSCGYCGGSHIGVHHTGSDGRAWWKEYVLPGGSYYWEESRLVDAVYETQYRYRDWIVGCR